MKVTATGTLLTLSGKQNMVIFTELFTLLNSLNSVSVFGFNLKEPYMKC